MEDIFKFISETDSEYLVVLQDNNIIVSSIDGKHHNIRNLKVIAIGTGLTNKEALKMFEKNNCIFTTIKEFQEKIGITRQLYMLFQNKYIPNEDFLVNRTGRLKDLLYNKNGQWISAFH